MRVTEHLAKSSQTLFSFEIIPPPRGQNVGEKGTPEIQVTRVSVIDSYDPRHPSRIRLGIESRPDELKAKIPLDAFVLSNFTTQEQKQLPKIFDELLAQI